MWAYLLRHGETDYQVVAQRGVRGWATSFAPLSTRGRTQILAIAGDYRLRESAAILTSSYARALESAAILSRALDKPLHVEYDLHEWLPQRDPLGAVDEKLVQHARRLLEGDGRDPTVEGLDDIRWRVSRVLERYADHASVVVVTHAVVIQAVTGLRRPIKHAEIVPHQFLG